MKSSSCPVTEQEWSLIMRGYLIYASQEAEKNKGFIRMFQQQGKRQGIEFFYVPQNEFYLSEKWDTPGFVINRTRRPEVSRWYEEREIPVFHRHELVDMANNKYKTLQFFEEHLPGDIRSEKWCPQSELLLPGNLMRYLDSQKDGEETVVKTLDGHGGSQVYLSTSLKENKNRKLVEDLQSVPLLVQEKIPSDSMDVRVYVLGGEIYQCILRHGQKDFRSNYSLGGQVKTYTLSVSQREYVNCFLEAMPESWKGMFGIDFILDEQENLIFNEVEEMVGCRMLYQCTDCDIVADYISWIKRFV